MAEDAGAAAVERCGEHYAQHPSRPELVAVCTLHAGHDGDHDNVLPKPLAAPVPTGTAHEEPLREAEELADFIAEQRDRYPRIPDDMDSGELAEAVLSFLARHDTGSGQ